MTAMSAPITASAGVSRRAPPYSRHQTSAFEAVRLHTVTSWPALARCPAIGDPDSACAVGLVRVEKRHIARREYRLIRPWTRRFEFTYLHGIAWRDVARAPKFARVWHLIAEMCDGVDFIAAHNADFDEGVLRACCARSGIAVAELRFECTVKMARRALGIYPTGLAVVAARLGIPLDHHNAASDASACAQIVLRATRGESDRGTGGRWANDGSPTRRAPYATRPRAK
jgi:DNA polymerase-3 subunit epsilon